MEEIIVNGKKIRIPKEATEEDMNDYVLNEETPTEDLSEAIKEINSKVGESYNE